MKVAVAVLALVAVASALSFPEFKSKFNKNYESEIEERQREAIFNEWVKYIEEFNASNASYTLGINEFADLTHAEFRRMYLPSRLDLSKRNGDKYVRPAGFQAPTSVDWRSKGYVTPVKNQGQCGSCWSFSTTGSVEGQHFNATGKLVSLSEQNLVDCSTSEGNQGCNGGLMDQAFQYIIKNKGIDTEESYPYTARDGSCQFNPSNVGATISSFVDVTKDSEDDLLTAVASVGPISIAIDASHPSFQMYKRGVYDPLFCSPTALDHGVLAVGYGVESDKDYWLVKNSWGGSWGDEGYILMARNKKNKCGVASAASYPIV